MTGSGLTGASLSTTWNGLTFSNVVVTGGGTTLNATLNISASAPVGQASLKVTTPQGFATTPFTVLGGPVLSREYVFLGDRVIAVDAP
jgi:hypothetical protein